LVNLTVEGHKGMEKGKGKEKEEVHFSWIVKMMVLNGVMVKYIQLKKKILCYVKSCLHILDFQSYSTAA